MADSMRKVGVQLVAEGEQEYQAALSSATQAESEFTESIQKTAEASNANRAVISTLAEEHRAFAESLQRAGVVGREAVETMKQLGISEQEAVAAVKSLGQAETETTIQVQQNTQAVAENEDVNDKASQAHNRFYAEMRAGRIAVAAITTEMALMTLTAGETLPAGLREAGKALQQVIDTATIGLLITNSLAGALAGGLVGAVLALVTVANNADPHLVELNKQLDTLAKKQDIVDTLAQITGWTEKDAQAALDMAKENSAIAQTLQDLTSAVEHQRNVFDALQASIENTHGVVYLLEKGIENIPELFGRAGDAMNKLVILSLGLASAGETYLRVLSQTGDASKAYAAGLDTMRNVIIGTREEQDKLNQLLNTQTAVQKIIDNNRLATDTLQKYADGTKSAASEVALYGQVSETAATNFLKFAESHQAVAQAAEALNQKLQDAKAELADLEAAGKGSGTEAEHLRLHILALTDSYHALILANQDTTAEIKKLDDAERQLQNTLSDIANRGNEQFIKYLQERGQAQQQFNDAIADSETQFANQQADAAQQETDRLSEIYLQRQDKLSQIDTQLNDRLADIAQQRSDKLADIATQLADREAEIETTLENRIETIQQGLANKLADLAHQREQQQQQINDNAAKAAQELADKLIDIERQRIEAIAALDFNTSEQLRNAKTDHDREDILRKRQFDLAQIDQKANDERQTAERSFAEQMAQFQKERQAATDNYNYQVQLAKRLAEQQIAEAERTAAQQRAVAERNAQEQRALAERQASEQMALAQRTANEQRAQAEKTYAEEHARAEQAYKEAVERAAREEAQKQDLANRTLGERIKAIDQQYEAEIRANDSATQKALENFRLIVQAIGGIVQAWQAFMSQFGQGGAIVGNLTQDWMKGFEPFFKSPTPNVGGASGLDMVVPEGYPNDSYHVAVSSGERVTVSPPNTTNNSSRSMTINMPIYDATNPEKVARAVKKVFADAAYGMA